ncbi:MAG: hypothetical protein GY696_21630 [Gammaproteobacteria bacterium]|nr:hypothetical protein [Gammaproteobacteria bacterium]
MTHQIFSLLLVMLLVVGCASTSNRPAPVTQRLPQENSSKPAVSVNPQPSESISIQPYRQPNEITATPVHGKAVDALLNNARRQEAAGDPAAAAVTVERALRIEPRNAHLWNRLANLRLEQDRYGMAADLAAKSNALAGGDVDLKRENWNLIAKARYATGDVDGARSAERKARTLY